MIFLFLTYQLNIFIVMYLICGYYQTLGKPDVKILSIHKTLDEANEFQSEVFGKIKKINNCWFGFDCIITWIFKANYGLLEQPIDIRSTDDAID